MPKGLKRYYGRGDLHFLTFSCYQRLPLLGTGPARIFLCGPLIRSVSVTNFVCSGMWSCPIMCICSSVNLLRLRPRWSLRFSSSGSHGTCDANARALPGQMRLAFPDGPGGLPRFWQPRFYDFNVWSKKKVREKLQYMHANPVTRRLVDHPQDWPWSSWSFYAKGEMEQIPTRKIGVWATLIVVTHDDRATRRIIRARSQGAAQVGLASRYLPHCLRQPPVYQDLLGYLRRSLVDFAPTSLQNVIGVSLGIKVRNETVKLPSKKLKLPESAWRSQCRIKPR